MKPKSNSYWCPDSKRPKMRFETEKKANNFIRYNGEDIIRNGVRKQDIRAYYCPSCCCYHITTKPYRKTYETQTKELVESYRRSKTNNVIINAFFKADDEIIREMAKEARKAAVTSIRDFKKVVSEYFAHHTQYSQKKQEEIIHKVNEIFQSIKQHDGRTCAS